MDFDYSYKMDMALAEILGINNDVVDMLGLELQMDVGKDDVLYGYYVKYPQKDSVDENILQDISEVDMRKIPWGETEFYSESQLGNTKADPFDWKEEWELEQYYLEHSPSKENVIQKLRELKTSIISDNLSELISKATILCAFSICESHVRKIVWDALPYYVKNDELQQNSIRKKLNDTKDVRTLYKKYTHKDINYIPNFKDIRHPLAHNIITASLTNNKYLHFTEEESYEIYSIEEVFDNLINFIENPIKN